MNCQSTTLELRTRLGLQILSSLRREEELILAALPGLENQPEPMRRAVACMVDRFAAKAAYAGALLA